MRRVIGEARWETMQVAVAEAGRHDRRGNSRRERASLDAQVVMDYATRRNTRSGNGDESQLECASLNGGNVCRDGRGVREEKVPTVRVYLCMAIDGVVLCLYSPYRSGERVVLYLPHLAISPCTCGIY
jgi:hypothetical protein